MSMLARSRQASMAAEPVSPLVAVSTSVVPCCPSAARASAMLRSVEAAMATLPTEQREILHLVCVEEMSYAETARILDIPLGTVMSRLSRARAAVVAKLTREVVPA